MPKLRSAFAQVQLYGMSGLWRLLRSNLCASGNYFRLQLDLRKQPENIMPTPLTSLRIERGDLAQLARLRSAAAASAWPADFQADRTHGLRQFYLGFWNEQVAHILWLTGAGDASTVSDWQPQAHEVEFRNVHTLRAFRRKGIFAHVVRAALRQIRDQGIHIAYAHVDERNPASLHGFRALGFQPAEQITIRRTLGVDRIRHAPIKPTESPS
ncbi:MAG: GNAT family N-acetyltransferase [Gammaproteobacteria bacterium]